MCCEDCANVGAGSAKLRMMMVAFPVGDSVEAGCEYCEDVGVMMKFSIKKEENRRQSTDS